MCGCVCVCGCGGGCVFILILRHEYIHVCTVVTCTCMYNSVYIHSALVTAYEKVAQKTCSWNGLKRLPIILLVA